uniref:Uncharacterized protein n=1 Tax=Strongyloides papillosus TaxID=174720 RepID=A0A0N5CIL1_STREA
MEFSGSLNHVKRILQSMHNVGASTVTCCINGFGSIVFL